MSIELEIVRDVTERLGRAGIPFMITGSMAMNAYAEPRMTRDLDVVIELLPADALRLVAAFDPDYYVDRAAVQEAIRSERMFNIIQRESVFKVDCIVRKGTPYRLGEFARKRQVDFDGCLTWIVSREDLILSKLCWGRESRSEYQARDIRNLLKTGCDREYLLRWAAELGVLDYLEEIEP